MSTVSNPTIIVEDRTNLETLHVTLKWSIYDFEGLSNKNGYLYSPGVTMAELGMEEGYRGRWRIRVQPCFSIPTGNNGKNDYVSVSLSLADEDLKSTVYIYIRENGQCPACSKNGKLMDVPVYTDAEFSELLTFTSDRTTGRIRESLYPYQGLFGLGAKALKDSCLNIAMDLVIYREPKSSRVTLSEADLPHQRYQEFLGRQLKQQEGGGDFLLISNDNKEFRVDRSFLMAHSPVFTAMLNHDSKEKQTSRCEMKDVDADCVEILLNYVCGCETGKIHGKHAEKVLVMADKYQMADLRAVCELVLAKHITVDNAVHVFGLARLRNLDTLKDLAMQFIRKNMDLEPVLGASLDLDM